MVPASERQKRELPPAYVKTVNTSAAAPKQVFK